MTHTDTRFLKKGRLTKTHREPRLRRIQCARLVDPIAFAPSRHQHIRCLQREEDGEKCGKMSCEFSLVRVVVNTLRCESCIICIVLTAEGGDVPAPSSIVMI